MEVAPLLRRPQFTAGCSRSGLESDDEAWLRWAQRRRPRAQALPAAGLSEARVFILFNEVMAQVCRMND